MLAGLNWATLLLHLMLTEVHSSIHLLDGLGRGLKVMSPTSLQFWQGWLDAGLNCDYQLEYLKRLVQLDGLRIITPMWWFRVLGGSVLRQRKWTLLASQGLSLKTGTLLSLSPFIKSQKLCGLQALILEGRNVTNSEVFF